MFQMHTKTDISLYFHKSILTSSFNEYVASSQQHSVSLSMDGLLVVL